MHVNTYRGLIIFAIAVSIWTIPPIIYGIPVPIDFLLLYVMSIIPATVGLTLISGVFNFDDNSTEYQKREGNGS